MRKKLKKIFNKKGETIPEVLVSIAIIAVSLCMLCNALMMGLKTSKESEKYVNKFYKEEGALASSIYSDHIDSNLDKEQTVLNIKLSNGVTKNISYQLNYLPEINMFTITHAK